MNLSRVVIAVKGLWRIYTQKRVSRSAAELSYFLTLSVFPTLICLNAMLGNLFPDTGSIVDFADGIIPAETMEIILDYLSYVSKSNNNAMLTAGVLLMATSSAAAFRSIHHIMADIQGRPRYTGVFMMIMSFLFSIIFLAAIYFAAGVMLTGSWFLSFVEEHFGFISITGAWPWLRFILLSLILYTLLYGVYSLTAPRGADRNLSVGALAATIVLVGVSIIFSWFIGFSVRYPLVYGSLASIIILMVWLYLCGNIIIMGNALNVVLRGERR